jgi:outer membrane protein
MIQLKRSAFLTVMVAAAGLLAGAANAQELKIGYVNSERVLREAIPAKAAQTKLEGEFGKRERELNEQAGRLKAEADKLEKEAPTLSEFQEDLNQRKNEELAAVVERANRVIKQIFDQEKYDLILQEVVFAGPKVDITDKVIKALNAAPPSR